MATTLASIRKQIADLEKRAEALIKEEAHGAIAKVRELIERYGLSAEDLGFGGGPKAAGKAGRRAAAKPGRKKKAAGKKTVGAPMYRDPESGKTWTGRGKPPAWIAGAKHRDAFLIGAPEAAPAEAPAKPARKGSGRKAAAKAVAPAKARQATKPAAKPVAKKATRKAAAKLAKPARGKRPAKPAASADQAAPAVSGESEAASS